MSLILADAEVASQVSNVSCLWGGMFGGFCWFFLLMGWVGFLFF